MAQTEAPTRHSFRWWRGVAYLGLLAACSRDKQRFDQVAAEPVRGASAPESDAQLKQLVRRVVTDVDALWTLDFQRRNKPYVRATELVFSDATAAPCAAPSTLTDSRCNDAHSVFIDLDFLRALGVRFGGDARAPQTYAIVHAMGHHVQRVLGLDGEAQKLLANRPVATHAVELQLELQADCFAGVWARVTSQKDLLDRTQVERALHQASDLGTERELAAPRAAPHRESFTYAVPRRRLYWFGKGFAKAKIEDCDTFATD
jgi:predicted metalloprotease